MKIIAKTILILFLVICYRPSSATAITFDFSGVMYNITSNSTTSTVSVGDNITGSYSYDPSLATRGSWWYPNWKDYLFTNNTSINIQIGTLGFEQPLSSVIVINDYNPLTDYYLDRLQISTFYYYPPEEFLQLVFNGSNSIPSNLLTAVELPLIPLDLSLGDREGSVIAIHTNNFKGDAYITGLYLRPASVDLPGSLGLLVLGFAGFAFHRHRIQRKWIGNPPNFH